MKDGGSYTRREVASAIKKDDSKRDDGKKKLQKEEKIHAVLDEIAKMRGYREILKGKQKIRPITQYVNFLLEKEYGFKIIRKGEEYYDRMYREYKIADKNITPIDQYAALMSYQNAEFFKSLKLYYAKLAQKEGFESWEELERAKAEKMGMTIEDVRQLKAEEMGFESWGDYQKYISDMYVIKERYGEILPKKDFDDISKNIKDKWIIDHQKFIVFCENLWNDTLVPFFEKGKGEEAAAYIEDIEDELDKFNANNPGSMNIYSVTDIAIGMGYFMETKGVDAILSRDGKSMKFRKRDIVPKGS